MRRLAVFLGAALMMAVTMPMDVSAQTETKLSSLLPNLLLNDIVLHPSTVTLAGTGNPHTAHFSPLSRLYIGQALPAEISEFRTVMLFNQAMITQFASFPLGSSSGGFTFDYNAATGTYDVRSPSFGPAFAERALTIGQGKLNIGANYQRSSYDTFEGEDLGDGSLRFYIEHNDCCPGQSAAGQAGGNGNLLAPGFEGDLVEAALSLKATTNTFALFANYGVTPRWDVGIAVPIVNVSLEGTVDARILRLATAQYPHIHEFDDTGSDTKSLTRTGSATGIGDVVLRTKYNFFPGLAAAADIRLPTGDSEDLLGSGAASAKLYFIASGGDRVAPHVNVGYTFSGDTDSIAESVSSEVPALQSVLLDDPQLAGDLPDELNYTFGVDLVATPNLTVAADVIGRTLRDAGRLKLTDRTFRYREFTPPATTAASDSTRTFAELVPEDGNLNLALGAIGAKFNPRGTNLLISGNVLFPLTKSGLRDTVTVAFGFDYTF